MRALSSAGFLSPGHQVRGPNSSETLARKGLVTVCLTAQ